ncbi:MAG TPA: NAD(P)/FAD-dependent oxidoreductase [Trebonia sp.]|nr:NAD(P)/FAD-dependent oxidoreductase [Trebonia sp.]
MSVRVVRKQPRQQDLTGEPVLIIGAGPAGLASAAELGRLGIPAQIIERTDAVASSWRTRYDRLRLNTCRWNAVLRFGDRFAPGTPFFPLRDQAVQYLESFAARHDVKVRFGVEVERIDPGADGWQVSTSCGPLTARQVVVATGHQNKPSLPDWPGRDQFPGRIVHSLNYRNPDEFRDLDVLVVGSGCSGLDIATDLARGGAGRVRLAARKSPNLLLKMSCGLPTDLMAAGLQRVPTRIADPVGRLVQRLTIGDLSQWGLPRPEAGIFTRLHEAGDPPQIVGSDVIAAIRAGEFEVVPGVSSVDADGVRLSDGTTLQPDAIVAATGYTTGLKPLVGHLGVLDDRGQPLNYRQPAIRTGLHFVGYAPCMGVIGRDAIRVMRHVHAERLADAAARPEVASAA